MKTLNEWYNMKSLGCMNMLMFDLQKMLTFPINLDSGKNLLIQSMNTYITYTVLALQLSFWLQKQPKAPGTGWPIQGDSALIQPTSM